MKTRATLLILLLTVISASAQVWYTNVPREKVENGTVTLADYQEAFYNYCDENNADADGYHIVNGKNERIPGWKQFKRWEWFMMGEVDAGTGRLPQTDAWTEWEKYLQKNPNASRSAYGDWTNLGPSTVPTFSLGLGRLNCIAFHPSDAGTWWVGAATGGIWKTTNYGSTWACLSDEVEIMGVADIIIPDDYNSSQTIYIATGDRNWDGRSLGVYKSTNGGQTWQPTDLEYTRWSYSYVNRLLKLPSDDNTIYAATNEGLYKTVDGGVNFNLLNSIDFMDMEFKPGDPDVMYASNKRKWQGDDCHIYRSTNGGQTWDIEWSNSDAARVEIAVTEDDPNRVYAVASKDDGSLLGVSRSINSGATFSLVYWGGITGQNILGRPCDGTGEGGQGTYDLCIAANPSDADEVFVGGINSWKSTDGGSTFNIMTAGGGGCGAPPVHVDHHNLVFRPGTTELYSCCDGGLYRSTDLGASWSDLSNGLEIGRIYRLATAQSVAEEVLTGYQDCGSKLLSGGVWQNVTGGDGMHCAFHPTDINTQYAATQNGSILRTDDHWASNNYISQPLRQIDTGDWVTPYMLDPNNPNILFVGMSKLYKSLDEGDNFFTISSFPDTCHPLRVMDIAPSNSSVMAVANIENLYISTNGGYNFTNITGYLPFSPAQNRLIMDITFKDDDEDTFWITFSSYDIYGVLETTDGGTTWSNISDGLPQIPVRGLVQNTIASSYVELYAATAMGVFLKMGNQPWVPFQNGMPKVYCMWLDIHYDGLNSKLRCGTWGRSVWESDLFTIETGMDLQWTGLHNWDWYNPNNWNYLYVPNDANDVVIPAGCPNYPFMTGVIDPAQVNNLTLENGAELAIGEDMLIINGDFNVHGHFVQTHNTSILKVMGDINWHPGSYAEIQAPSASFIIEDDWTFESGSNINLANGVVNFTGSGSHSVIYKNSTDGSFHDVVIQKSSPKYVIFAPSSVADLTINGHLTIFSNTRYSHQSPHELILNGNFYNSGLYTFLDGGFTYGGQLSVLSANGGSHFNDLTIDGGPLTYLSLDSETFIDGDLYIIEGSLDGLSNTLHIKGDWNNSAGEDGFIQNSSRVVFDGSAEQIFNWSEEFNILELDNSSGITISNYTIECESYDWSSGLLKVNSGGHFIADDLYDEGIEGYIELNGTGHIEMSSSTFIHLKGDVTINNGTFDVYGGIVHSAWPSGGNSSLTMTNGEFNFHDQGIYVHNNSGLTFTEDITGGTITTTGYFVSDCPDFHPTGGTVKLTGDNSAGMAVEYGSLFHNLTIDKTSASDGMPSQETSWKSTGRADKQFLPDNKKSLPPNGTRAGGVTLTGDILVNNTLKIEHGDFNIDAYTAEVLGRMEIHSTLVMNDPSGRLEVNGNVEWQPGSADDVTDGNITFTGSWNFMNGCDVVLSDDNRVTANGMAGQIIGTYGAEFQDLILDNSTGSVDFYCGSQATFRVNSDLTVNSGVELVIDDSVRVGNLVYISGTIDVESSGILHCDGDITVAGELNIAGGEVRMMDGFVQLSIGVLDISSGNFFMDKPYTGSGMLFLGTTNQSGGLIQVTHEGATFGTVSLYNGTSGTLNVGGTLKSNSGGTFQPSGGTVEMIGGTTGGIWLTGGNYCRDLIINKTPNTIDVDLQDSLIVKEQLTVTSGDLYTQNHKLILEGDLLIEANGKLGPQSGIVEIYGDWTNNRGSFGFNEGSSEVIFMGETSYIQTGEIFNKLTVNKQVMNDIVYINDGLTVEAADTINIQDGRIWLRNNTTLHAQEHLYVSGEGELKLVDWCTNGQIDVGGDMVVEDGGICELYHGSAEIDADLELSGFMSVDSSDLDVHGGLYLNTGSVFKLFSGNVTNDQAGPGVVRLKGRFEVHDGIFEVTDRTFQPVASFDDSITGGIIRIGRNLDVAYSNEFNPYGGRVEFTGTASGLIDMVAGNTVYDLRITKIGAQVTLIDNLVVSNDVRISAGTFDAGSFDIDVGGDWTNDAGDSGFNEGNGLVTFNGTGPDTIHTDEKFYDLYINKSGPTGKVVELPGNNTVTATNECRLVNGALNVNPNGTLDVRHLQIQADAGLLFDTVYQNTNLIISGNWTNTNSTFTATSGFRHGRSHVTFTGASGQTMASINGEEFHMLTIDKSARWFKPLNTITVLDECTVADGTWDIGAASLSHYFYDDFELSANGIWMDSTATLIFKGDGNKWLTNFTASPMTMYLLKIDQPGGKLVSGVTIYGELKCRHWAYVRSGTLGLNGGTLNVDVRLEVNSDGLVTGSPNSKIRMADNSTIFLNGGALSLFGSDIYPCYITNQGSGYYQFNVVSGGHFSAIKSIIEYPHAFGIHFYNGGFADTLSGFANCTFRNGEPGGTLLRFSNDQVEEFWDVNFPDTPVGGNYNVHKTNDAGDVTFLSASGAFSGPTYENDIYGRVHWSGDCVWTGLVSTDWHTGGNWSYNDVPDDFRDVIIPDSTPNDPMVSTSNADAKSLMLESEATLTLAGSRDASIHENADIWGELDIQSSSYFRVEDTLTWKAGSDATLVSNGIIYVYDDMVIENGSELDLTDGSVVFKGANTSHLTCHQDSATIFNLKVDKSTGSEFYFDDLSTGDLVIRNNLYNYPGNHIISDYAGKIYIEGAYVNDGGNFSTDNTHFVFSGDAGSYPLRMKPLDTFYDLTIASTSMMSLDDQFSDSLNITGDLTIIPGPSGSSGINANGVKINMFGGDWTNNVGYPGFIHNSNVVTFEEDTYTQSIYGNNAFYELKDKTSGTSHLRVMGTIEVFRNFIINHKAEVIGNLYSYGGVILTDPASELILQSNSYSEVANLYQGGTLTCNSGSIEVYDIMDDYLLGDYIVNGGTVAITQDASHSIDLDADITINGGDFKLYGGNGDSKWPVQINGHHPTLTISNGTFDVIDQGIWIETLAGHYHLNENITGGTISTKGQFNCFGYDTDFNPDGGVVQIYGGSNTNCQMSGSGNHFYNLRISKTGGGIVKNIFQTNIKNTLTIESGTFHNMGNPVNVGD